MKVRALPKFEGIRDKERSLEQGKDVYPKAGDVWEVSEERAAFLKSHGVIEYVKEVEKEKDVFEKYEEEIAKEENNVEVKPKKPKKKKSSKK